MYESLFKSTVEDRLQQCVKQLNDTRMSPSKRNIVAEEVALFSDSTVSVYREKIIRIVKS